MGEVCEKQGLDRRELLRHMKLTAAVAVMAPLLVMAQDNGGAGGAQKAQRTLSYEGATTIGTVIMPDATKLFAQQTGVTFSKIGGAGADAGYRAAEAKQASLGGVARELTADERQKIAVAQTIGYDVMGLFVNAKNPVKGLTKAQLKDIFTGKTTNWKEVGGPDKAITVYSEKLAGGRATVKAFKDMVLGPEKYGPVKELEDATDCIADVVKDEGGIAASSMSFAAPGATAIAVDGAQPTREAVQSGKYPLKRPLILVSNEAENPDVKAFLQFMLTPEAQAIVGRKFVPAK